MDNKEYLKAMGERVRQLRREKGFNTETLRIACKLSRSAISDIENGKKNSYLLTLKNIADKIGVDVKDFL
ncbi:helix-turn-helix domain-containing protein [Parasediminibacterium sp. JCM 36343]|uniref:helix-turn-helix domain-containing protein n=1 Tax=Parasediminibacterium sp. JCM 36343 TaxID=3374279 RepID=UPI00397C2B40